MDVDESFRALQLQLFLLASQGLLHCSRYCHRGVSRTGLEEIFSRPLRTTVRGLAYGVNRLLEHLVTRLTGSLLQCQHLAL